MTYQAKVISGGKIVIPAELRRALSIKDGDKVSLSLENGQIRLEPSRAALDRLRAWIRENVPKDVNLVDELIAERRAEAARE